MPTLQFHNPVQKIAVTKNFPSPVKITDLWKGWYKTCQKIVPSIPDVPQLVKHYDTLWDCDEPVVDEKWIKYTLTYKLTGERAHLVINRKGPSF